MRLLADGAKAGLETGEIEKIADVVGTITRLKTVIITGPLGWKKTIICDYAGLPPGPIQAEDEGPKRPGMSWE